MTARQSNIEILRIFVMFLIVLGHAATHGTDMLNLPLDFNGKFTVAMSQGARVAVDVFVIITGYFLTPTTFNRQKFLKVYRQIWFYSVLGLILFLLFAEHRPGMRDYFNTFFPVFTSRYWFATTYVILLLFTPYLNILIGQLNKNSHGQLLLILIIVFSFLPTILPISPTYFNFISWFIALYLIGAYLREYEVPKGNSVKVWHGLISLCVIMGSAVLFAILGKTFNYYNHNVIFLFGELNRLPALLCAVLLFLGFKNWKIRSFKWINVVAASTFAVYLFSDHPLIRDYIFIPIKNNLKLPPSQFVILYFAWVIIIFVGCILIDLIRKQIETGSNKLTLFLRENFKSKR